VDLAALAAVIDTARSSGDLAAVYDELAVQGFRRPSRRQPTREEIVDNVDVLRRAGVPREAAPPCKPNERRVKTAGTARRRSGRAPLVLQRHLRG